MKKLMVLLLVVLMVISTFMSGCTTTPSTSETPSTPETPKEEVSASYTATAQGFGGDVTVTLTIKGNVLEDVIVEGENETDGVGSRAIELMPSAMLSSNSIEVDTVSGATITSNAILEASSEALAQSGVTLAAIEVKPVEQSMKPGTYYGEAYGKWKEGTIEGERFGSPAIIKPTKVAVTVDENKILKVEVLSCDDTPGFIEPVIERIPAAIVDQQSIAVDVVTGATMTSNAVILGVTQALTQAGANLNGFNNPAPKSTATETYDTDLVVVGAGGSGTIAALTALEAGLDVVILEKCGKVGGQSVCSTGMMTLGSKRLIDEFGEDALSTQDEVFLEMMNWASWRADASVVKSFLANNGDAADFLQDHWDKTSNPGFIKKIPAKNGMDTGKGTDKYQVLYDDFIIPLGGKLMLETTAYELIMDGDKVVGVKARKQDGTEVVVNATNVILATGGFAGNPEMLEEYLHNKNYYLYGLSTNTGDGLRMALKAGATLTNEISPHLAEFCSNLKVDFYAGYMKFINYTGLLQVGPEGNRFYNEELGASDPLAKGASALNAVGHAYVIFTQKDLDILEAEGCAGLLSEKTRSEMNNYRPRACVPFYTIKTEMQNAIDAGEGWKADSLEELGKMIGFDPEVYNQTINDYLLMIEQGEDTMFGKRADMLYSLSEGPFYAVRIYPALDGTLNGIRVNKNMQALDKNLKPIQGLYMAGYDAGSFWAFPYYQTDHTNA
ncbi:MAG TPA: FAD-binding protein, partial [Tissierellia bacterium]|nr:FAD-binding protein [Tissierellia bacterium]